MPSSNAILSSPLAYHLAFRSLRQPGRGYAFPCDDAGAVLLDELSERARDNYFYARACVGREFLTPEIVQDH